MDTVFTSGDTHCLSWMTDDQIMQVFQLVRGKPVLAHSLQYLDFVHELEQRQRAHKEIEPMTDLWVSGASNYEMPPEGRHLAVCSEVKDLGMQPGYQGKPTRTVELWFQLEGLRTDGQRHRVRGRYTLSLHEKSNLHKTLVSWRGRKFTTDEMKNFNLGKVEGVNAELMIIHDVKEDGRTFANINNILPPPAGAPKLEAIVYEAKDRPTPDAGTREGDDKVPF